MRMRMSDGARAMNERRYWRGKLNEKDKYFYRISRRKMWT